MVLIDLDGTLVDSVPDLAWCVDEMMKGVGLESHGEARVRHWVGNGVERLVCRALTNSLDGEPEAALFERAFPLFSELYAENSSQRSQLYPGVIEGLEWLKGQPLRVGCVTNKAERYTLPILADLGIADYFEIVVSGDTLAVKKPDPAPLLHVSDHFGLRPAEAAMIGDSMSDVKAARAAGFSIICMSYGYNHGEDIRDYSPDAVIDSMAELPTLFVR
ncbi:MAG: phosphoglycolate phosphatase [Gammaproteobacteria bacterium]|nr:phosphoglycolate phosphatase [Gammaproteobacteria bacterium]MBT7307536.1 phosphoglycolate phosphatase [Gammaproteobacteria bacterium]